ncbi:DUF177 domain-containing protein [Chloroflexota bacterium]
MRINVAQQLKEPVGSVRQYEIEGSSEEGHPIKGKVHLTRTNRSILVKGMIETGGSAACSRCLEEFVYPLSLEIEEEYLPTRDLVSGLPLPLQEGVFIIDENHILDLTEAVRQYALLAKPMNPVCQQNCAGLCAHCGHNLNCGPCDCMPAHSNSPWAQLQALLTGGKKQQERGSPNHAPTT